MCSKWKMTFSTKISPCFVNKDIPFPVIGSDPFTASGASNKTAFV
jgi:hypothetical protein